MGSYVAFFSELGLGDARQAGGKGANLGHLSLAGFPVPGGFCVKAEAYDLFISSNRLEPLILGIIGSLYMEDLEGIDAGAARIREMMESSPVPPAVEEQARAAYRELLRAETPGALVAVRSSVGTRDLSASSFPGQMDTYHNVATEDDVLRLVRACWASAFSYRALVSRHARGIGHMDVFVAPLVQLMVPSDTAGVVFTANPLNRRRDQMVINACFGLGEGVVSGEVSVDHHVLDRDTLEEVESVIGDKRYKFVLDTERGSGTRRVALGEVESRTPCLDPARLARLAGAALEIEAHYGCPQDIEWAYSGGKLYILQSRAVTALGEPEGRAVPGPETAGPVEWVSEFDTEVDPCYPYYTLSNISEVLPGVLTPLTISGIDHLDYGFVKTNENLGIMKGIKPDSRYVFLGIFYGRVHLNLSVVKTLTTKLPGASAQEFERMVPSEDEGWEDEGFKPTPRALLGLVPVFARVQYKMLRTPRDVSRARRRLDRRVAEARGLDLERLSHADFLERMSESGRYRSEVIVLHITASQFAVVLHEFLRKLTARWLDDDSGAVASRLVTGLQNIESAEPVLEIWDLSRMVARSEELRRLFEEHEPGDVLEALEAGRSREGGEFLEALGTFLSRYGYRSVFESELMLPNWEDDPSFVFAMIGNYLDSDASFDPREQVRKQERERRAALDLAWGRLRGPKRWIFSRLLKQVQRYIALREFTKATLIIGIAQIKKEFHALSRSFAADGIIEEPLDLFFLSMEEVETLAGGGKAAEPTAGLVARRRNEYERNKTVVLPEYSRGRPRPLTASELERQGDVEVLYGIPVSPGKVSGAARVITDPRARAVIKPGEILVAPVTDAAWTPLFVTASAIVVDVGGPLSHGSIVAREFGIPGVLNVGAGTKLIKDGQWITVDGDEGKVYLHPAP